VVIKYYRQACLMAKERVRELTVKGGSRTEEEKIELLERCAATALNSKLISGHAQFFAKMAVQAIKKLEGDLDLDLIGMKKEPGGSVEVCRRLSFFRKVLCRQQTVRFFKSERFCALAIPVYGFVSNHYITERQFSFLLCGVYFSSEFSGFSIAS
jgi:hypothetical protein